MFWLNFEDCLAASNFLQARLHALAHTSFLSSSPRKGTDLKDNRVFGLNAAICPLKKQAFLAAYALLPLLSAGFDLFDYFILRCRFDLFSVLFFLRAGLRGLSAGFTKRGEKGNNKKYPISTAMFSELCFFIILVYCPNYL